MSLLHFRFKERRRTVRVTLTVGLTVRWQNEAGDKFRVKTTSHAVSREGGLFPMEEPIVVGQELSLVNENSGSSIDCKVTTIRKSREGKTFVGVEFIAPNANFWQMCFPVPGTKPLRRSSNSKSV